MPRLSEETKRRRAELKARWAQIPSVYCSCGAEWHGQYAIDNPVIEYHRQWPSCQVRVGAPRPSAEDAP